MLVLEDHTADRGRISSAIRTVQYDLRHGYTTRSWLSPRFKIDRQRQAICLTFAYLGGAYGGNCRDKGEGGEEATYQGCTGKNAKELLQKETNRLLMRFSRLPNQDTPLLTIDRRSFPGAPEAVCG